MSQISELIKAAFSRLHAMSPEEQTAHWEAQRQSWARGMRTPCEHGQLDYEQCAECRKPKGGKG